RHHPSNLGPMAQWRITFSANPSQLAGHGHRDSPPVSPSPRGGALRHRLPHPNRRRNTKAVRRSAPRRYRRLDEAAHLTNQPMRQNSSGQWEADPDPRAALPIDWAEFVTHALAGAAANIGGN